MNLNELYRLICNLARIGTVLEVDTEKYLARVETGENKTDWIRWAVPRAGEAVTVDLTDGATGGPFTSAQVISLTPASAGQAIIVTEQPASAPVQRMMLRAASRIAEETDATPAELLESLAADPDRMPAAEALEAMVPVIRPVAGSRLRPGGRPVAV